MNRPSVLLLVAWLIAVVSTGSVLFIGEVMGMIPCVLCWYALSAASIFSVRAPSWKPRERMPSRGSSARRISASSALQSMVAILNSLPWLGLLAAALTGEVELEHPAEQQVSTLEEVLVSSFMA